MRKLLIGLSLAAVAGMAVFVMGCASVQPVGVLYTEVTLPTTVTSLSASPKVGTSECTSILALVAFGDASIEAAAKSKGITKIHSVDWEVRNILGIYGVYRTIVRGE